MAYGQTNYQQKLGTGPSVSRIADVGCFLTAFCNLLERFGEGIDPPTLNNFFIQHGTFLADGPNRDNLAWGSISAYDGNVVASQIGGPGWPKTNNAIVKFVYKSSRTGAQLTHFCLVADWTQRVIIDSWDGHTKVTPYGNPVAWATYDKHMPQVIVPPPPIRNSSTFTIENIPAVTKELRIRTQLWDLTRRTWPEIANNPVTARTAGFRFETNRIAHHVLGGNYYIPSDSNGSQGYNVVDCQDPTSQPAPTPPAAPPAPTPPPAPQVFTTNKVDGIVYSVIDGAPRPMYVTKPDGIEKWSFKDVSTWRDFRSVQHIGYGEEVFIVGKALHPIPPTGAMYYMTDADFGDFKKTGRVTNQYGFNKVDLSDTRPPVLSVPTPAPVPVVAPAPAVETPPIDWKDTYKPFPQPVRYISARDQIVSDLSGKQPNLPLPRFVAGSKIGVVLAYGTVTKDDIEYYRLKAEVDTKLEFWYCVPKLDPVTRTANLLIMPADPSVPINTATTMRDTVTLARSHIEFDVPKFLDDIIPKWLKNKK